MLKRPFLALLSTLCVSLGCGPVQPYAGPGEMAEPVDDASYDGAAAIWVLSDVGAPRASDSSVQTLSRDSGFGEESARPTAFVTAARTKGAEEASATSGV